MTDKTIKRLFLGALLVCALVVAFWTGQARADIVQLTWVNPTQYANGAALPASSITRTRVEYGTNTGGAGCTFGARIADVVAAGSATSVATPDLAIGSYAFRAYTTASGLESSASVPACKAIVQSPPNPPSGLTVAVTVSVTVTP